MRRDAQQQEHSEWLLRQGPTPPGDVSGGDGVLQRAAQDSAQPAWHRLTLPREQSNHTPRTPPAPKRQAAAQSQGPSAPSVRTTGNPGAGLRNPPSSRRPEEGPPGRRRPGGPASSPRSLRPPPAVRLTRGARHCGSGGAVAATRGGRAAGREGGKGPRLTGSGVGRGRVGRGRGAGGAAPAPSEQRPARRRHVRHQQPRSREETAGKHAGRPAGPEPGVQEKISSRQRGEERPGRGAASEGPPSVRGPAGAR